MGNGVVEICMCKQSVFSQQEGHYLNIKEQSETSYRLHSWLMYMQGTCECVIQHVQSLQVNGEHLQHWQEEGA